MICSPSVSTAQHSLVGLWCYSSALLVLRGQRAAIRAAEALNGRYNCFDWLALLFRGHSHKATRCLCDTRHCREIDKCKWLARVAVPMDIDAAAEEAATLPERRNGSARPMKRYPHTSLHESVDAIPAHNAVLGPPPAGSVSTVLAVHGPPNKVAWLFPLAVCGVLCRVHALTHTLSCSCRWWAVVIGPWWTQRRWWRWWLPQ